MIQKIIKGLWLLLAVTLVVAVVIFISISKGWIGYMPPVEELENPNYKFATEVLSEDGKVLGTWSYSKENRVYTSYDELSPHIIQALVATEDVRFRNHSGIDGKALFRAFVKRGLLFQKTAGGGSTLTQQLAKQLYTENVARNSLQRLLQKPIEWVIAVKLERYYTKEEILSMYLNKFDFLNNAVGVKTASHTYFGVEPGNLSIEQAATLVGMCQNPSRYNPVRYGERAQGRRNVVLEQMRKAGYLTDAACDSIKAIPLKLNYTRVDHKEGLATYFREYLRGVVTASKPDRSQYRGWQMQKYYEDSLAWETDPLYGWCAKNQKPDGTNYNVYTDGLKIYTTIDSRMQRYAEEAVKEHIDYLQPLFFKEKEGSVNAPYPRSMKPALVKELLEKAMKQTDRYRGMKTAGASDADIHKAFDTPTEMTVYSISGEKDTVMTPMDSIRYYKSFLRTGFLSMSPLDGHVKAYVGGTDYTYFQYDMAMVGRRQVGSTIKPFLYTLAMENGFSPCDEVRHVEQTVLMENGQPPWTPRNANKKRYGEMVTLKWGLANSDNWISAYLMTKLNPHNLVNLLHTFGVKNRNIDPVPALCLGPCDVSVGEMVSAYTAFANKGIRVAPLFVTRIEDSEGNVIANFTPRMEEVISANSVYKMLVMLRDVINGGTGSRVRSRYGITADMGGKTGTTNDNSDAWFIGFTPTLVSGCWVGGDERDIHFGAMTYGQGAAAALPVWGLYMKKVYADPDLGYTQDDRFDIPNGFDPCGNSSEEGEEKTDSTQENNGLDNLFN
ncbi:MAG: transglycosylase domain-containing protein [Mediterranea sp.]|jgi:penicillin-binding protein 1A|nr:transglycosylase domain-containing protein [Mediterranea sp.]